MNQQDPRRKMPPPQAGAKRVRFDPRLAQGPARQLITPQPMEKQEAAPSNEKEEENLWGPVQTVLRLILFCILAASIFVIPTYLRPFWVAIVGVLVMSYICFQLYYEWDRKAFQESLPKEDRDKYKSWAIGMLYIMNISMSGVLAAILLVMMWRIYTTVSANSNLFNRSPSSPGEDSQMEDSPDADEAMQRQQAFREEMMRRKRERRRMRQSAFV